MTRVSVVIRGWPGWCPKITAMRSASTVLVIPSEIIQPSQPDGGAGGSGKINRTLSLMIHTHS